MGKRKHANKTKILGFWNRYYNCFDDWVEDGMCENDCYVPVQGIKTKSKKAKKESVIPNFKICPVEPIKDD